MAPFEKAIFVGLIDMSKTILGAILGAIKSEIQQ
jgi:hypothetical protein